MANLLKNTIKDFGVYIPGKLLPGLTAIITLPIISRIFSPEEYGVLSIILVIISIGGIILSDWLTSSSLRFFPYYKRVNQLDHFYSTLFLSFLISCILFALISIPFVIITSKLLSTQIVQLLPISGLVILISGLFSTLQILLRADQRAGAFVVFELYRVYCALGIGFLLVIKYGFGIVGMLWGTVFAMLTASLLILVLLFYEGVRFSLSSISVKTLREFSAYGLPGLAATIGTWMLSLSDRYVIEIYKGSTEVGLYSMAYTIADRAVGLFVVSIVMAAGPILFHTWESDNRDKTAILLSQIIRGTIILLSPMVIASVVLATPVMEVLTTQEYISSSPILFWVSLGSMIYGLSLLSYTGLNLAKKMKIMARNYLLAGAVNILLNILLIPYYGFIIAAVTTTISYMILLILNIYSARPYLPFLFPWKTLWKSFLASIITGMLVWLINSLIQQAVMSLLLGILLGFILYLVILLVLHEFNQSELKVVRNWVFSRVL